MIRAEKMERWSPPLLSACTERCAEFGDPPCRDAEPGCEPCADCLCEVGIEVVEPIDPAAVVKDLFA